MERNGKKLWTLKQTALAMGGVPESALVALTEGHPMGALPAVSHKGKMYFDQDDILQWLKVTAENVELGA